MTTKKPAPGRPWQPGTSGNPTGRPRGSRNRQTVLAQSLLDADAGEVVRVIVAAAKAGDLGACRALLGHILPPVRERPISLDLPATDTAAGVQEALGAVLAAVGHGSLLPGEAQAVASLLEGRRRAIETVDLEARIQILESKGTPA